MHWECLLSAILALQNRHFRWLQSAQTGRGFEVYLGQWVGCTYAQHYQLVHMHQKTKNAEELEANAFPPGIFHLLTDTNQTSTFEA